MCYTNWILYKLTSELRETREEESHDGKNVDDNDDEDGDNGWLRSKGATATIHMAKNGTKYVWDYGTAQRNREEEH